MAKHHIRVVELFAGVGGFRVGLEGASDAYETIWNNQWEPSTQHQDASLVYKARFGAKGHSNKDINLVPTKDIPDHDLMVGGKSVASFTRKATSGLNTSFSKMSTVCLIRLPHNVGATLPSSLPRWQTSAMSLNGASSTLPTMACLSAGEEHTSLAIRMTQS